MTAATESSRCANALLTLRYYNYVHELDVFGRIAVESDDDASASPILFAEGAWSVPAIAEQAGVTVVSLRRWSANPTFDHVLEELTARVSRHEVHSLLLDLRSAAGVDPELLAKTLASAKAGWGSVPIVLWVDAQTRGTPEVFARDVAALPNVLIAGQKSAGYARVFCRQTRVLAEGTPSLALTLGCSTIKTESGESIDGKGVMPQVVTQPADVSLRELQRLRDAGVPINAALVAPVASISSDSQANVDSGRVRTVSSLISTDHPGTLEDMVRVAARWSESG